MTGVPERRHLSATYRLQLHPGFGFDAAAAVAGYVADLGASHVYCSPYLQAAAGSTHGYDVVDHSSVNDELGGEAGHARFGDTLGAAGLGQVLDIVPNHMAIVAGNRWWWDVLAHGPASRFARYFDVDWDSPEAKLRNTVLLPILADHYGRILEAGGIRLHHDGDAITVRYEDHVLPVSPASAAGLAAADAERITADPDALDAFLAEQNYRLAYWRTAGEEVDYRRFFDISTLIGLRAEDPTVFAATHERVLEWLDAGVLDGVRVDHVDGLRRPAEYTERLRAAAGTAWIVVEKILERDEQLPGTWPVDGTTGYDALNMVGGLLVDPAGEKPLTELYVELTGESDDVAAVVTAAKDQVLRDTLAADVLRLTELAVQVTERHRRVRDFTRADLRRALRAIVVAFPVYRTYVTEGVPTSETDRRRLDDAFAAAAAGDAAIDPDLLHFLRSVLGGEIRGALETELAVRFQQLTPPAMAKGVEDTAFYRYHRLVALNEVGGDPDRFGVDVAEFHRWAAWLAETWPRTMTTLSTHDTKRSEDVRARLAVLSEVPDAWAAYARRWVGDEIDAATAYGLLQNVAGAWPLERERLIVFAGKAVREAKLHTSWTNPDEEYEQQVRRWIDVRYDDAAFVAGTGEFVSGVLDTPGRVKSLAQKLVQLTMPGIPDVYQGTELWDFSLVDPDNRRPVDYDERRRHLAAGDHPKLRVVQAALAARRRLGELGSYTGLPAPDDAVAFARGAGLVTIVPRFATRPFDLDVALPPGEWRDLLPGLPVRLLERA